MQAKDRIIFPLDGMDPTTAEKWMERLKGRIGYVKIGLELFLRSGGWSAVEAAKLYEHKVMLDLKLHDIPATMRGATAKAVEMGVDLLTVHASAGREALKECVNASSRTGTKIVAVTVLTSLDEQFIQRVFRPKMDGPGLKDRLRAIPSLVGRLTVEATEAGVDWFVCSPKEANLICAIRNMKNPDNKLSIITPGIRLAGGDVHDQKRVDTPGAAIWNGADYLVIGRAIRGADDPDAAIAAICAEIDEAFDG